MRTLKLMCDYYCYPLWDSESDNYNVDPLSLNISQELNAQLMAWAHKYDALLNQDYPPDSGFKSQEEELAFREEGFLLAQKLQKELGGNFHVSYLPDAWLGPFGEATERS